MPKKVVFSHVIDCEIGEVKAISVVYEDGSIDVNCPNCHDVSECSAQGGSKCPYQKY